MKVLCILYMYIWLYMWVLEVLIENGIVQLQTSSKNGEMPGPEMKEGTCIHVYTHTLFKKRYIHCSSIYLPTPSIQFPAHSLFFIWPHLLLDHWSIIREDDKWNHQELKNSQVTHSLFSFFCHAWWKIYYSTTTYLPPSPSLDVYELTGDELGKGAYSSVATCHRKSDSKELAVKVSHTLKLNACIYIHFLSHHFSPPPLFLRLYQWINLEWERKSWEK